MALNDINVPSAASDVVGVFDQNFNQVFPTSRPIKAEIRETSRPMEHPVETGVIITDHRIILPTEIELSMILPAGDYRSVYQQIKQYFNSAQLLSVQTRTDTYANMFIVDIPHQEDAELFDTVSLAIRLKQVLIVTTQTQSLPAGAVKDATQQSTINNGAQSPGLEQLLPPPPKFIDNAPAMAGALLPTQGGSTFTSPQQAQAYSRYNGQNLPPAPMTDAQASQILNAVGYQNIIGIGRPSP